MIKEFIETSNKYESNLKKNRSQDIEKYLKNNQYQHLLSVTGIVSIIVYNQ